MQEQLLGFCNTLLRELGVTREQIDKLGGADAFARLVGEALKQNGLRLAVVEEVRGK